MIEAHPTAPGGPPAPAPEPSGSGRNALVIGATGYVGSAIVADLKAHGYQVSGVARSPEARSRLEAAGVAPVDGDAARIDGLRPHVAAADVVVFTPMIPFDIETQTVASLVDAMPGPDQSLVFISGSAVVATASLDGSWNDATFAEDDPFPHPVLPTRQIRLGTEQLVRDAAQKGMRSFVVRPPLIYGHAGSIQVPQLFESARQTGSVCYLGAGRNLYSNVHVDDVAVVTRLAIERGTPGAVYHSVSGEADFRSIAEAVADVLGLPTKSIDYQAACALWGPFWVDIALAVNSRLRAPRTRADLGWKPLPVDLLDDIRLGSYAAAYADPERRSASMSWLGHGTDGGPQDATTTTADSSARVQQMA